MTARDHNKLLSIFFFIMGGLQLFAAIIVILMYGGMGTFFLTSSGREEEQAMGGTIFSFRLCRRNFHSRVCRIVFIHGLEIVKRTGNRQNARNNRQHFEFDEFSARHGTRRLRFMVFLRRSGQSILFGLSRKS